MLKRNYSKETALAYANNCERAASLCWEDIRDNDYVYWCGMCYYLEFDDPVDFEIINDMNYVYREYPSRYDYYMGYKFDEGEQLHRMTALLFMAEIYRDMAKEDER